MFLKSRKLPANTPSKFGETMRISFNRREEMENKPLLIMMFNHILGRFETKNQDIDSVSHRLYIKQGIEYLASQLL